MRSYRVGPTDFPANNQMHAYEITLPVGHYLNDQTPVGLTKTVFDFRPYQVCDEAPEPLDSQVTSQQVLVAYPDYLEGRVGLTPANRGLVLKHLNLGLDIEIEVPA